VLGPPSLLPGYIFTPGLGALAERHACGPGWIVSVCRDQPTDAFGVRTPSLLETDCLPAVAPQQRAEQRDLEPEGHRGPDPAVHAIRAGCVSVQLEGHHPAYLEGATSRPQGHC